MKPLPKSDQALVVGTDFSDDAALEWRCRADNVDADGVFRDFS